MSEAVSSEVAAARWWWLFVLPFVGLAALGINLSDEELQTRALRRAQAVCGDDAVPVIFHYDRHRTWGLCPDHIHPFDEPLLVAREVSRLR